MCDKPCLIQKRQKFALTNTTQYVQIYIYIALITNHWQSIFAVLFRVLKFYSKKLRDTLSINLGKISDLFLRKTANVDFNNEEENVIDHRNFYK